MPTNKTFYQKNLKIQTLCFKNTNCQFKSFLYRAKARKTCIFLKPSAKADGNPLINLSQYILSNKFDSPSLHPKTHKTQNNEQKNKHSKLQNFQTSKLPTFQTCNQQPATFHHTIIPSFHQSTSISFNLHQSLPTHHSSLTTHHSSLTTHLSVSQSLSPIHLIAQSYHP